jgi:hypothetical protein
MTNKESLCVVLIVIASVVHVLVYSSDTAGFAEIAGSLTPSILISYLFSKFLNKKASREQKVLTFTITFCVTVALLVSSF